MKCREEKEGENQKLDWENQTLRNVRKKSSSESVAQDTVPRTLLQYVTREISRHGNFSQKESEKLVCSEYRRSYSH